MDACPPLEDIAAFLDDRLSAEERERVTAHLARCESCYEVFIGAAELIEEESSAGDTGEVVPPPSPLTPKQDRALRRIPRWFPLAASIALVAGAGYFAWQASRPAEITLAGAWDAVEGLPAAADHLYEGKTYRNLPPPSPERAAEVMTAVRLLDLRLSVEAGRPESTEALLGEVAQELGSVSMARDLAQRYQEQLAQMEPGMDVRRLKPELQRLESEVQDLLGQAPSFSFGLWAEAGRLSAATGSPAFFEDRNNRRLLARFQEEPPVPDELRDQAVAELQVIERHWGNDFSVLKESFRKLIDAVDDYDEDFPEDLTD